MSSEKITGCNASGFQTSDNPYTNEKFFKTCENYDVPHDLMKYRDEKYSGTHQHGSWSNYTNQDSITHWIIEKSQGFTDVRLLRISESVRRLSNVS